ELFPLGPQMADQGLVDTRAITGDRGGPVRILQIGLAAPRLVIRCGEQAALAGRPMEPAVLQQLVCGIENGPGGLPVKEGRRDPHCPGIDLVFALLTAPALDLLLPSV